LVLTVEVERLRQENDKLRSENAALRPLVSELKHKLRQLERAPDFAAAETEALVRKSREHA
jgi:predicted RNase H-like nuclease (RuvC/YqgF family)